MLLSIITPTYNCLEKIQATLDSVLSQSFSDYEYLIIDGDSTDGTRELISRVEDKRVRFLSEPDTGIYDAMNKGVRMARGQYMLFLGAGDYILPDALANVSRILPRSDAALVYGNVYWRARVYDGEFSGIKLAFQNICHQAIFYSREVFDLIGEFETEYKLLADWDLNMRCFGDRRIRILHVPITVSVFEDGGLSCNRDLVFERNKDRLIRRHLGWITYAKYRYLTFRNDLSSKVLRRLRAN